MMEEENQERRYVCKFCNKSCFSGKSLGGHMRGHLALISAARKGKEKALSNIGFEEGGDDHSSSVQKDEDSPSKKSEKLPEQQSKSCLNQEKSNNSDDAELEGGEEEDCYGLRENPKKSWKISGLKCAASRKRNHCKECGRGFPSVRALAGHKRCHSLRKREDFPCKKCNKVFDSMRALFGHMKCHSKRSRVCDEGAESISEFANLCPKKKRSRIRYKPGPNISFSSINTSSSSFLNETEEVEDAAWCLMMLSRAVRNWDAFNSIALSPNHDDSVTFEAVSLDQFTGISKNDAGDFVCGGENSEMENLRENLNSRISITSAIGDGDSGYASGNENIEWEVSLDSFLSNDKFKKLKQEKSEIRLDDFDIKKGKDLISVFRIEKADLESMNIDACKNLRSADHDSRFWEEPSDEMNYVVNDSEILEAEKTPDCKCMTCGKIFNSHRALTGHRNKHKVIFTGAALSTKRILQSDVEASLKPASPDCCEDPFAQEANKRVITSFEPVKGKDHQCPICFKIFSSGQALGGHKRAHYAGFNESKNRENLKTEQELPEIQAVFSLGLAATGDGVVKDNVDNELWWTASSHEHEALMVSN